MLGPDGRPFKSRAGDTARLADLLADAVSQARTVVAAKHPDLDAVTLDERARQVGIGALKYADLTSNRARDYIYDPARMLALAGNTSVYLQYAHARVRSILTNAQAPGRVDTALPLEPAERTLVLDLDAFGDTLVEVANTLEPHRLCHYLYRLAKSATTFLDRCRVLTSPAGIRENRLALCELTGDTLRTGLDLLGIEAPNRL
jgi:arginyl-tRNA synthetase